MGNSVFETFQSRASKFEEDLLLSFSLAKQTINNQFTSFMLSRGFVSKFKILSLCVTNFLTIFTKHSTFKLNSLFISYSFSKLTELVILESKLSLIFQKKSVSLLLYPLIFKTSKNNVAFLTDLAFNSTQANKKASFKTSILKSFSLI
jgi:hypothetical protein